MKMYKRIVIPEDVRGYVSLYPLEYLRQKFWGMFVQVFR